MQYFKINDIDFSMYVNALNITHNKIFNSDINANGDTVADYINTKRSIEVGIIPLDADSMKSLLNAIEALDVLISFYNPRTDTIENNVRCIIANDNPQYYTIRQGKTSFKAFTLNFNEM